MSNQSVASVVGTPLTNAPEKQPFPWMVLLLPVLAAIVYWPGVGNTFVGWDDYGYIRDNRLLRSWDGLGRIWTTTEAPQYYPLTFTTHWLEYQLWGPRPVGYYLVSVALHTLNGILVFFVASALGASRRVAWFAAAVFVLHPLQVASAAWMAERKTVLSGLFYFLTLWLYAHHRRHAAAWSYGLALVTFSLALLSKTVAVTLVASLFLVDWWLLHKPIRGSLARLWPLCALALGPLIVTSAREQAWTGMHVAPALRPLLAAAALWFYVRQMLAPLVLVPVYPRWQVSATTLLWWLPLIGVVLACAAAWRWRKQLGALAAWGLAQFVVALLPALGLVHFGYLQFCPVADHLAYVSVFGFALALGVWVERLATHRARLAYAIVGLALAALGAKTWSQVQVWRDPTTLWTYALRHNPAAGVAWANLGVDLAERRQIAPAIEHFQKACQHDPGFFEAQLGLAAALLDAGRPLEALAPLAHALELAPREAVTHVASGNVLVALGNLADAATHYRTALQIEPHNGETWARLGQVFAQQGNAAAAIEHYQRALQVDPTETRAHVLWGDLLFGQGDPAGALARYEAALRQRPDDPLANANIGTVLARAGRVVEAIPHLQTAVTAQPDNANAHFMLALALRQAGKREGAIAHGRRATELVPTDGEAHELLGATLAENGQVAEGLAHLRRAAELRPGAPGTLAQLAWVLATTPESSAREPAQAVALAERARQLGAAGNPRVLDALAAAYAASGRFPDAVPAAQAAADLARQRGDEELARQIEDRLSQYRTGQAYTAPHSQHVP